MSFEGGTPLVNWLKSRLMVKSPPSTDTNSSFRREIFDSPVAALAQNIEGLSTNGSDTSFRRKILVGSGEKALGFQRHESVDEGCSLELLGCSIDGSNVKRDCGPKRDQSSSGIKKFKSLPLTSYGFVLINSPKSESHSTGNELLTSSLNKATDGALSGAKEDESSQDSGIGFEKDDFKIPRLPLSQLSKAQFSNSTPVKGGRRGRAKVSLFRSLSSPAAGYSDFENQNKKFVHKSNPVRDENCDDFDDGFIDMFENSSNCNRDSMGHQGNCGESLNSLTIFSNEPFKNSDLVRACNGKKRLRTISTDAEAQPQNTSASKATRRNLFSLSNPTLASPEFLDVEVPLNVELCESSSKSKRFRSSGGAESLLVAASKTLNITPVRRLVRCQSEAAIKMALMKSDGQCGDLIGDFSQPHCLPLVPGRHQDLRAISSSTMASILNGEYVSCLPKYFVVDCRYPYEFDAGHLQGALNIFSKDSIIGQFFSSAALQSANTTLRRRPVIIFHCEFSSERGPKLMRFLRNTDRECNTDCYPALHYPELYLLEGGYKDFFHVFPELCEPRGYKPMLHESHADEMKRFRAKTRSWNQSTVLKSP